MKAICSIENCERPVLARGWCKRHYARWYYHGDPLKILTAEDGEPLRWLIAHVSYDEDACLIWPFARSGQGYANLGGQPAIRMMCEKVHGPAPTRKHEAAHSCGKGSAGCISPKHLRWATRKQNHADKVAHGTTNRGKNNPKTKLTENQVREVRRLSLSLSDAVIARRFGVTRGCVSGITTGKNWGWLS